MHLFNLKKSLVFLYICLVALLAAVTFVEHVHGTEFVEKYVYHTVWFCCLWGVLAALAVAVLVKRQLWRRLPTLLFPACLMAAASHIVVAWLLPRYLGGSHDYIFIQQKRIYASHSRY